MEKIIIDGVDVSKCKFIDEWEHCRICDKLNDGHCLIVKDIECATYSNCYYKQLQQLKQENEELKKANKKIYNDLHKEICEYDEELSIEKASHKFDLKTLDEYRSTLKKIDKKMELALDVEQTDAEESFDLLYEIQEMIAELLED